MEGRGRRERERGEERRACYCIYQPGILNIVRNHRLTRRKSQCSTASRAHQVFPVHLEVSFFIFLLFQ